MTDKTGGKSNSISPQKFLLEFLLIPIEK